MFFFTCHVRVVRFYVRCPAPSSSLPRFLPSILLAGPPLPALARSGPCRTSIASSRSQWASPDLICQLFIAVGLAGPHLPPLDRMALAGPHLPPLDRSGPRRTSTGESQPARFERCGPRRTSTDEIRSTVLWASPDHNRTSTARNKAIENAKDNAR